MPKGKGFNEKKILKEGGKNVSMEVSVTNGQKKLACSRKEKGRKGDLKKENENGNEKVGGESG